MTNADVELGLRHAAVWAGASEHLGSEWLEHHGPWMTGRSSSNQALLESTYVTISEDGDGGIDWCIERDGWRTYGRAAKDGTVNVESLRTGRRA